MSHKQACSRFSLCLILLLGLYGLTEGTSPLKEVIVVASSHQLKQIQSKYGAAIIEAMPAADAYLIAVPASVSLTALKSNAVVMSQNLLVGMTDAFHDPGNSATPAWKMDPFYSSNAPRFYIEQPAALKIKTKQAYRYSTGKRAVVALIDTGIDEQHPVLSKSVVPGRNYVASGGPSEWNDPWVDQGMAFDLLQRNAAAFGLNQAVVFDLLKGNARILFVNSTSAAAFRTVSLPPAFGHGTMVAGVVHLVAPDARLMPMKAFDGNGRGTLWNVIRAVRDAVDMRVDVINMSFSAPSDPATSELLQKLAVDYAKESNIAMAAAAGNANQGTPVLPAANNRVSAVAGVLPNDIKAPFSNYGSYVDFSAPATGIITTYPGAFAIVSGTSFSTPFVSGLYALLEDIGIDGSSSSEEIEDGSDSIWRLNDPALKDKLGKGRINVYKTLSKKHW